MPDLFQRNCRRTATQDEFVMVFLGFDFGYRRIGGMRAPGFQEFRQNMGMRPRRRDTARVRPPDLLIDLDTPDICQRNPVRVRLEYCVHDGIIRLEQ